MPQFDKALEVRAIARGLIADHHTHLTRYRVRIEYIFSDQEVKAKGKLVLARVDLWTGVRAWMAPEPEGEEEFPPLTFVCRFCRKWCSEGEYNDLKVGSEVYAYCPDCVLIVSDKDLKANKVIVDLTEKAKRAGEKEVGGPPKNPDFFVVTFYRSPWCRMRDETRLGVVDHQLCHMGASLDKNGDVKLVKNDHDLEDFNAVAERHGPSYRGDIIKFDQALRRHQAQMEMQMTRDGNTATLSIEDEY